MSPGSRRVRLYWLLLLLPTLAVGTGALWLLRREQARLDEQAKMAVTAKENAIAARARLIAENVELLVGDVQAALMGTLQEAPPTGAEGFFNDWEKTNPLVRATFQLTPDGRVLRPAAGASHDTTRSGLAAWLIQGAPWQPTLRKEAKLESDEAQRLRRDVASNVAQVQSARSAIKDVATLKNSQERQQTEVITVPEQMGWVPWRDAAGLHLFGWRRLASGMIFGVEVELKEVANRLGDILPKDGDQADAFVLREAGGATLQSKVYRAPNFSRSTAPTEALVTVPIAANVLPGWEVAGFTAESEPANAGGGFFLIGSLLIGIFMIAILAGGSLLLGQARRSEAEAVQKTSFVANVSHEFKTPLTTIRLYAELLEQGRVRDDRQRDDYLRTIGRETERLARLVNNALDFSRLEQGQKKYAREKLEVGAELNLLLDTHAPRIEEAGLKLRREFPDEPLVVESDRDALGQIVLNLLDNACKYAAAGGEVTVSLVSSANGQEVRVADRGPGVPPEHRERIFEKFHRVDDALTADKGGAGLGLSIARQLARGLGGDLRFEAREGEGAVFILKLS